MHNSLYFASLHRSVDCAEKNACDIQYRLRAPVGPVATPVALLYHILSRIWGTYLFWSFIPPHSIKLLSYSGGSDVFRSKCLPNGGTSDYVTGSPASNHSTKFNHSFYSSFSIDPRCHRHQNLVYPPTTYPPIRCCHSPVGPQPILGAPRAENFSHGLPTPPLTPDDSIENVSVKPNDDALELSTTLFQNRALMELSYTKTIHFPARDRMTVRFCCLVSQRRLMSTTRVPRLLTCAKGG